jgi:hypothetical protein
MASNKATHYCRSQFLLLFTVQTVGLLLLLLRITITSTIVSGVVGASTSAASAPAIGPPQVLSRRTVEDGSATTATASAASPATGPAKESKESNDDDANTTMEPVEGGGSIPNATTDAQQWAQRRRPRRLTVRLFLVRHGETVANVHHLVVGQSDSVRS